MMMAGVLVVIFAQGEECAQIELRAQFLYSLQWLLELSIWFGIVFVMLLGGECSFGIHWLIDTGGLMRAVERCER